MKCKHCGEEILMNEVPLIDPAYFSKDMWGVVMNRSGVDFP